MGPACIRSPISREHRIMSYKHGHLRRSLIRGERLGDLPEKRDVG